MLSIQRFDIQQDDFDKEFSGFLTANTEHESDVSQVVRDVINQIRANGDTALVACIRIGNLIRRVATSVRVN